MRKEAIHELGGNVTGLLLSANGYLLERTAWKRWASLYETDVGQLRKRVLEEELECAAVV